MSSGHFDRAAAGFAEGERYERARPGYPPEAVDALCERLGVAPGVAVLDLAAGTGKLTRELAARGAAVVAVEPVAGMRAALVDGLTGIRVLDGTAEAIPVPDGSADAVTVAQAFHWFDGRRAIEEIHRVLRPGGMLGLLWNVMDRSVPWVDRLQRVIHARRGEHPWYAGHEWRRAFAGSGRFGPFEHVAFRNAQSVDLAGLRDRVASISFIGTLPGDERAAVMAEVEAVVRGDGLPAGEGRFDVPYVTDVFSCVRRP